MSNTPTTLAQALAAIAARPDECKADATTAGTRQIAAGAPVAEMATTEAAMPKPQVTSIRFFTSAPRRQPKSGDRRTTKKHGLQIRVFERHNGMLVVSGSRYRYEWRRPAELDGFDRHYLTPAELAALPAGTADAHQVPGVLA